MTQETTTERKIIYYYDLEVFPNFFSALFISEDFADEFVFYKFEKQNDMGALIQFISQPNLLLVGFNSVGYDDIILKWLIKHPRLTNKQIYNLSKKIIETKNRADLPKELKDCMWQDPLWLSADMMALLRMNLNVPGLKHCAIHLEHGRLQDLPKSPHEPVTKEEIQEILSYNRNDVIITGRLWQNPDIQEAIYMRYHLGEQYNVNLISADDSRIANVILEHEYGIPTTRQTRREVIHGRSLIPPTLKFVTPEMLKVKQTIEKLTLIEVTTKKGTYTHLTYPKRRRFEYIFDFNGVSYTMAKGGLHSNDEARILCSDDKVIYRDADVASYYPWLRQVYELAPLHLDKKKFLEVDKRLIDLRIAAKTAGDKVTAEGLKITINGIFGKMNYQHFWLYDPLCFYQTTIFGQLLLLMLIEMLYLQGIKTVSANTDGIVCEVPRALEQTYFDVCLDWQKQTGMSLEYTDYEKLVQLNVNSYMSITSAKMVHNADGSIKKKLATDMKPAERIKTKKDFSDNKHLSKASFLKGYYAPVIALALQNYFKDGTPIEDTINSETNVHNFLFTQKAAAKFELYILNPDGSEKVLQKTNRFYITPVGAVLLKRDKSIYLVDNFNVELQKKSRTAIWKGHAIHIFNNVSKNRPEINRKFYINKTKEIIEKIEPPKKSMTIFDFI